MEKKRFSLMSWLVGLSLFLAAAGFGYWFSVPLGGGPLPDKELPSGLDMTPKPRPVPQITEPSGPPPQPVPADVRNAGEAVHAPPATQPGMHEE